MAMELGALDVFGNVSGSGPAQMMQPAAGMPQEQMPKMEQHIARLPVQDMRARPPQGGIGSFQNPFGGFMGGGRGNFMRPQPPMYGGGFGGFGMQPPMFGGGMGYGMPPMFGGGMYGGGFGMQPPMFGGGFGSPFGQSFYGGIGGMFPGMGGGYGMQRPPSYGGFGGGNYNFGPQPALPIRPQPMPIVELGPPKRPMPVRPSIDRPANYSTDRRFRNMQLQPF